MVAGSVSGHKQAQRIPLIILDAARPGDLLQLRRGFFHFNGAEAVSAMFNDEITPGMEVYEAFAVDHSMVAGHQQP